MSLWGSSVDVALHPGGGYCLQLLEVPALQPSPGCKHGVNLGSFDTRLIASVRVRRFDGADTWKFIDE